MTVNETEPIKIDLRPIETAYELVEYLAEQTVNAICTDEGVEERWEDLTVSEKNDLIKFVEYAFGELHMRGLNPISLTNQVAQRDARLLTRGERIRDLEEELEDTAVSTAVVLDYYGNLYSAWVELELEYVKLKEEYDELRFRMDGLEK